MTKQEILDYLNQYRNAGNHIHREAMDAAIEALEKQIKRKPIEKKLVYKAGTRFERRTMFYVCPCCGNRVEVDDNEGCLSEYYPTCECGQRIDWEGIIDGYDMKWNENWSDE